MVCASDQMAVTIVIGALDKADSLCLYHVSLSRPVEMCSPDWKMRIIYGSSQLHREAFHCPLYPAHSYSDSHKMGLFCNVILVKCVSNYINQSYLFYLDLRFFHSGTHTESDELVHCMVVMREPWSALRSHNDPK